MEDTALRKITLVTVQSCNLKCLYCYETHKKESNMLIETAKEVIDSEIARFPLDAVIQIEIIGGEPFLASSFLLFQQIVDYVNTYYSTRNISYTVTTNGTLVHNEIQTFLMKYSNKINLSLSLDGRKKSHNLNRIFHDGSGSFDQIDIPFFQNYPIPVNAKMTVSPLTLKYLADDIAYVSEELGLIPTATFATGIHWEESYNPYELIEQLNILVERYSQNPQLQLPRLLQVELKGVFATPNPCQRPCGAGEITRTFTPDCINSEGDIHWYPCQGLAPITLGDEDARKFQDHTFSEFELQTPCASCTFRALCPSCQATNYGITGDVGKQSRVMCLLNRLNALASSSIQYNRIMAKGFDSLSEDDQVTLKAIQIVQTEIFDLEKHKFLWDKPL